MRDYEAIGKLDKALSLHADEAYDELNNEGKKIAEKIFKSLTELGKERYGIRHPEKIETIAKIANVEPEGIIEVVDVFRQKGRSFLIPPPEMEINAQTVVDISHESLMRIWERLRRWVEEEAQSVQMYLRLVNASALYSCNCEGNFDGDSYVDGSDGTVFKEHFGRSHFIDPCETDNPCNGDFDCDGDVDGNDASIFREDFGRSPFNNPCLPDCDLEQCTYQGV